MKKVILLYSRLSFKEKIQFVGNSDRFNRCKFCNSSDQEKSNMQFLHIAMLSKMMNLAKKQLVGISDEFKLKDLVVSKFAITEMWSMIYA